MGAERAGNERGGVTAGKDQCLRREGADCVENARGIAGAEIETQHLNGARVDAIESFKLKLRHGMIGSGDEQCARGGGRWCVPDAPGAAAGESVGQASGSRKQEAGKLFRGANQGFQIRLR